ncbi:MAG: class I SAM-dependent methyltransferase [Gemmatimonadales bacterium]
MNKRYDKAYFDKWYRDPRHRVGSRTRLLREIGFVVAATEQLLERPLRSVLDVGAGEGRWQPLLQELRPGSRYAGVEPSEYAVARWGTRRNLRHGDLDSLDTLGLDAPFDLVVCADVLHYLPTPALRSAMQQLAPLVGGVAYLPTFAAEDDIDGDRVEFQRRRAASYRAIHREAGLVPVGLHLYVTKPRARELAALERFK